MSNADQPLLPKDREGSTSHEENERVDLNLNPESSNDEEAIRLNVQASYQPVPAAFRPLPDSADAAALDALINVTILANGVRTPLQASPRDTVELLCSQIYAGGLLNVAPAHMTVLSDSCFEPLGFHDTLASYNVTDGCTLLVFGSNSVAAYVSQGKTHAAYASLSPDGTAAAAAAGDSLIIGADDQEPAELRVAGLMNYGNTCYFNSCLQNLFSCRVLRTVVTKMTPAATMTEFLSGLFAVFNSLEAGSATVYPRGLFELFIRLHPDFAAKNQFGTAYQQQDAQEALSLILELLDKTLSTERLVVHDAATKGIKKFIAALAAVPPCGDGPAAGAPDAPDAGADAGANTGVNTSTSAAPGSRRAPTSLVHLLYELQFEYFTEGPVPGAGQGQSAGAGRSTDTSLFLTLPITPKTEELTLSLQTDFMQETVAAGPGGAPVVRQCRISRLPVVLNIHLARFAWDEHENKKQKLLRKVVFPMVLDMAPYCTEGLQAELRREGSAVRSRYELVNIIAHKGRLADSGHFVSYTRHDRDGQWCCCNDDDVYEVSLDDIANLSGGGDNFAAYVLTYAACGPEA